LQQYDQYEDKWEVIRVSHTIMSKEEEEEREEALAEVTDPLYLIGRVDADADGELEMEDHSVFGQTGYSIPTAT
jgi:RNA polymerase II-associated factor 1